MSRDVVGSFTPGDAPLSNQIKGSEKGALIGSWLGAIVITIVPLLFFWHTGMPFFMKPGIPNPVVCMFLLVGVVLFGRAIYETVRIKRFGDPVLDLTQVPVPLGGKVEGRINLGSDYSTAPEFALKLQCVRLVQSSGKNNSRIEKILWSGDGKASLLPGGMVPISIAVPDDQLESNSDDPWNKVFWRLTVTAPFRGIKFLEKYEIPVQGRTSPAKDDATNPAGPASVPVTGAKVFRAMLPFFVMGLAVMAGGIYLLIYGIADIQKANASVKWPTVAGHVIHSSPPSGSGVFGNSRIVYSYEVSGVTHSANTVYPHLFWKRSDAVQMMRNYPSSSQVEVHYSPTSPADACLLPGLRAAVFQRLVLAALVTALGFVFVWSAILSPKYAEMTGTMITFKDKTPGCGFSILMVLALAVALWVVS